MLLPAGGAASNWWRRLLPVLGVPMRQLWDGGFGFLTANLAPEEDATQRAPEQAAGQAIVAFEDHRDAEQVQRLWDA